MKPGEFCKLKSIKRATLDKALMRANTLSAQNGLIALGKSPQVKLLNAMTQATLKAKPKIR